jgi:hypothetical protein
MTSPKGLSVRPSAFEIFIFLPLDSNLLKKWSGKSTSCAPERVPFTCSAQLAFMAARRKDFFW